MYLKTLLKTTLFPKSNLSLWRYGAVVITTAQLHSTKPWTQVLCKFQSCSWHVRDSQWWGSLTIVLAGNKVKCPSSVNHTTRTIHHHIHYLIHNKICATKMFSVLFIPDFWHLYVIISHGYIESIYYIPPFFIIIYSLCWPILWVKKKIEK